jgi:hypothetical protein
MNTRKPRPLRSRGRNRSVIESGEVWVQVPIPERCKDWPREYRRVAAWLRKAANWFECLAEKHEAAAGVAVEGGE